MLVFAQNPSSIHCITSKKRLLTTCGPATPCLHPHPLIDPVFQHIRQCPTCIKVNKSIDVEARRYIKN